MELTSTNSPCVLFLEKPSIPVSIHLTMASRINDRHISVEILECDKARQPRATGVGIWPMTKHEALRNAVRFQKMH